MKKFYFLLLGLCLFSSANAQNPSDRDPSFNQFNMPLNHYFVDADVRKSTVLPDGKILLITEKKIVRLEGNLLDTSFNAGTVFTNSDVMLNDFAVQTDGKILVAGSFQTYNNQILLTRLNPDGSIDANFNLGIVVNLILKIILQQDGKIIILTEFGGLRRLNANGTLDTSFNVPVNYKFSAIGIQADGKLVVCHNTYNDYYSADDKVSRLNTNGSFDTTFTTATFYAAGYLDGGNVRIKKIFFQNDGKIVIGGRFSNCNAASYRDLVRLNSNGTTDTSFQIGQGFFGTAYDSANYISDIIEQLDGKLIVCGNFKKASTIADGFNYQISRNGMARLNLDGSLDTTFADVNSFSNLTEINSISFFNDEKILTSGATGYGGQKMSSYIVKINNDGTRDPSFNNFGKGFFNYTVYAVKQTADGKILVGGRFYTYNGSICYGFTRLNYDGSIDNALTYGGLNGFDDQGSGYITALAPTSNGKTYIGGWFLNSNNQTTTRLFRINTDGTTDTTFNVGTLNGEIKDILPLSNGYVLAAGSFSVGVYSSGLLCIDATSGYSFHFNEASLGNNVNCLKMLSDGKVLVGLQGNTYTSLSALKKLDPVSWTFDTSFVLDPLLSGGSVTSIEVQQDGKILLCGQFQINGVTSSIARILSNGSLDPTFNFSLQSNNVTVKDITLLTNQKIVISLIDSSNQTKIVRLNNSGSIDNTFDQLIISEGDLVNVYSQTDGKILIYGELQNSQGNPGSGLNRLVGEDYNFIQGQNKMDSNTNGCDINDSAFTNLKLHVSSGSDSFDYITNATGNYNAAVTNGTHTITPIQENPTYFTILPSTVNVTFPTQASPFTQNFCITPNGTHPDLEVTLLPIEVVRPGFDAYYKIIYKNKGTNTQSGSVNLTFNDAVLDLVSANPTVSNQTTNNLSWSFTGLAPFETREITFTLNVNTPLETPAVNGGDILNYTTAITSSATDDTPLDNTFALNQIVVNSFDPNDKTCLEGATITPAMIGQYVHYMIRFENTGTYPAENIVVKDMIDATKFDVSTLVPISGSHPFVTRITETNKVEFIFENINLPFDDANNDGYVAFKIKTKPTLVVGNTFSNTASIYFDYNAPIVTDPAVTTIAVLGTQDFEFSTYFSLYPNPTTDILNIDLKKEIEVSSINIYNTLGQLVLVIPNAQEVKTVDVSGLTTGNYFMKLTTDKGTATAKFIKK